MMCRHHHQAKEKCLCVSPPPAIGDLSLSADRVRLYGRRISIGKCPSVIATCVGLCHVRDIGGKGLQCAIAVVVEDPVFSPVGAPND